MNYYAHPIVRARMAEFLGIEPKVPDAISGVVMIGDACQTGYRNIRRVHALPLCFEPDFEISRSLWDSASLLIDLDIEYLNFDFPAEPYIHADRAFALQDAVIATAENQLRSFGIAPLHLLSGRGHHFIWRVHRDSRSFDLLIALGHPTSTVLSHYERMQPIDGVKVDSAMGTARTVPLGWNSSFPRILLRRWPSSTMIFTPPNPILQILGHEPMIERICDCFHCVHGLF